MSRAFTRYTSRPACSRMSYSAIQYTPVDCIATVRIPHCSANWLSPSARPWCTRSDVPVRCPVPTARPRSGIRCRCQCRRHPDVSPPSGCLRSGSSDLPRHLAPLLAVHLLPIVLCWAAGCVLGFLLLLGFHANRSTLNSTWLGPVSETYSISPAGSGPYPFSGQRRHHLYNR